MKGILFKAADRKLDQKWFIGRDVQVICVLHIGYLNYSMIHWKRVVFLGLDI